MAKPGFLQSWRERLKPPHSLPAMALVLFAWFAATAWWRPLLLPDEGRYVGVAWEMLRTGHWAVPTLDGLPFFHKPALFYWISAAAMQVFGASAWAGRMPAMLGATLAATAMYGFCRRWSGDAQARTTALVLSTQPFFFVAAQFANLDMLVAGCITAAILTGAHAVLLAAHGQPSRRAVIAAYALAAAGVLAKGLVGAVLPAATLLAWLLAARRPKLIGILLSLPGLVVFGLLALPWFVAMQLRYAGFYDYFIVYHHVRRFANGGFNNPQPTWFYLPVILTLALPWTLALPAAWRYRAPAQLPPGAGNALGSPSEPTSKSGPPPLRWLMWCWFVVVVVFFSLPKSKLVGYVLPALPPLAWLLAQAPSAVGPAAGWPARRVGSLAGVAALMCLGVVGGVSLAPVHSTARLGEVLRRQRTPGEPVILLQRYDYDLPFHARLETAPQVLDDWTDPAIPRHDDWRKELYDAGRFDPEGASRQLISRSAVPALLCTHARAWVIGKAAAMEAEPLFAGAQEMARDSGLVLWRLARDPVRCGGRPSAGSSGT